MDSGDRGARDGGPGDGSDFRGLVHPEFGRLSVVVWPHCSGFGLVKLMAVRRDGLECVVTLTALPVVGVIPRAGVVFVRVPVGWRDWLLACGRWLDSGERVAALDGVGWLEVWLVSGDQVLN